MTGTHRAIVRHGPAVRVEERSTRSPSAGELLLAPERVSLCGTDIQILRRDRDDPSEIVGHEGAARVAAVGSGIDGFAVGDRVVVNPTHPSDPSFLLGHNVEGLFQERVIIGASAVDGGLVSPLPEDLPSGRATLVEPFAVVRYALSCLAIAAPDTLVIHGDGLIGNLAALTAPHLLFPTVRVIVIHRSEVGLRWTQRHLPGTINLLEGDSALADHVGDSAALLVATHRGGTVRAIESALTTLGARVVAAHPIGGVPAKATSELLPGIDISGVRQANTGGPWPPATITFAAPGRRVALTGNRGVTSDQLIASATALRTWDDSIDLLLTHTVGIEESIHYFNTIIATRTRIVDGELVLRLVVALDR
ncbi:alcohol dehydrogenase catalytic domain-containing protein [Nocardia sp. NPDC051030]|uniref:alcohol dehydrogenase catalytic domain-containing protein n=1 Tax=Nocardia sp. NPDC051030 TaxID=3155162 RepID=UPI003437C73B